RAQAVEGVTVVRVGDIVDLVTSKGVELVVIPNVIGRTWTEAKPILEEAGFDLDYNFFADAGPDFFTVSSLDPAAGESAPRGSTVRVGFSA
ncbi:MAG: PASTA domain-containing protein, partial [Salinibacterium sp.]|nr:PASTA domain-containing protein [Salinibacterium sp.]